MNWAMANFNDQSFICRIEKTTGVFPGEAGKTF